MRLISILALLLALCLPAAAVVAVDGTTAVQTNVNGVTTMTISNLTVGSGANRALIVHIGFVSAALPAGLTVTWDSGGSNQTMTAIPGTNSGTNGALTQSVVLYGLLNPTSGNKNLVVSWTGSLEAHGTAISFTGVDQTSIAVAFPNGNFVSNTGAPVAPPAQVVITSAVGNIVTAVAVQNVALFGGAAGTGGTIISNANTTGPNQQLGSVYYPGAASVTAGLTWSGSNSSWIAVGTDVKATGGGGGGGGDKSLMMLGVGG